MAIKILILTPRIPFPLRDGGSIAMSQSIEEYLQSGCEVSLLAMNTSRHWVDESNLPEFYKKLKQFESVYINNNINPLSAFLNLFTDKSYNVERFVNKVFRTALIALIQKENFDIIQFESIYVSPYLDIVRKNTKANCICRVHNLEHLIWQRLTENEPSFLKRNYLKLLTQRLKNYELNILKSFDLLLPISAIEATKINELKLNTCYYLPFGVSLPQSQKQELFDAISCYHIGSMDWAPNIEGVRWLIDEVWPLVHTQMPELNLCLAGKNMPNSIVSNPELKIEVIGEVDDVQAFSYQKNIMLVPLLSGAGIRIKILEAMALGKTIISTTVGTEGIDAIHGQSILIADSPDEFANAIQFCHNHPDEAKLIGELAQQFVQNTFDRKTLYQNWLLFYKDVFIHGNK